MKYRNDAVAGADVWGVGMDSYFAPPERATDEAIQRDAASVAHNPVMSGVLSLASGVLAVLNEQRQVLAVNDAFLSLLGIEDARAVLGLRPGEAIQCVHAHEMPGGCGTSQYCASCGAAVAIVTSLAEGHPEERKCVAQVKRDGRTMDLCLHVRACRVTVGERQYVVLFLNDMTAPQRWSEVERMFFHDISNIITGMSGAAGLLRGASPEEIEDLAGQLEHLSARLAREVAIQKFLLHEDVQDYRLTVDGVSLVDLVGEVQHFFSTHPVARDKEFVLPYPIPERLVKTDITLLLRVLTNMLTNAFEATLAEGEVRLWVEEMGDTVTFCVWNDAPMPADVARRVFQRHFSTKGECGRGLGTYAMKYFGEKLLGGKVDFSTSTVDGTIFRFSLPV